MSKSRNWWNRFVCWEIFEKETCWKIWENVSPLLKKLFLNTNFSRTEWLDGWMSRLQWLLDWTRTNLQSKKGIHFRWSGAREGTASLRIEMADPPPPPEKKKHRQKISVKLECFFWPKRPPHKKSPWLQRKVDWSFAQFRIQKNIFSLFVFSSSILRKI